VGWAKTGVTLERRLLVLCCEDEGGREVGGQSQLSEFHGLQDASGGLAPIEKHRPGCPSPDWHIEEMSHSRKAVEFVGTAK
jgi:hypothetical protein